MNTKKMGSNGFAIFCFLFASLVFLFVAFLLGEAPSGSTTVKVYTSFIMVGMLFMVMSILVLPKIFRDLDMNHIDRIPAGFYKCLADEFGKTIEVKKKKYYSLVLQSLNDETRVVHAMVPEEALQSDRFTGYVVVERKRTGNIVMNTTEHFLREEKRYNTPASAQVGMSIEA